MLFRSWELEDLDGIEKVYSLTNVERLSLDGDLLTMDYYFPADLPPELIGSRRDELLQHPLYKNVVISGDGRLGGILVNVDDDYNTYAAREELLAGIDSLRVSIPWEWHDAGLPIIRTRYVQLMNRERAIFPEVVLEFIRETQQKEWSKLEALHGAKTGEQILTDLCKWMDLKGSIATLNHGFKCYGRTLLR